ncbi:MAG TPA: cation:proton antiporter [Candidatus Nitrosotalea sp.]|nr:cation:proton antiporter [Candidatus Nitrosotalea sp.]
MIDEIIIFLAISGIIFFGFGGEFFFQKTRISYYLFLILIGIILGPIFHIFPRDIMVPILGFFSSFTLIMIMFYSGMDMKISEVIKHSGRTLLHVVIYVVSSIFTIGLFGHFVMGWDLVQSMIFGSMVGGETTAAVVIPLTRNLKLHDRTITFLTLESTINTIFSIVFFTAFLDLHKNGTTSLIIPLVSIGENFLFGIIIGIVFSISWLFVLRFLRDFKYTYVFTLGLLFLTYSITQILHGNGIIAVLIFGLFISNEKSILTFLRQQFTISDMRVHFTKFQSEMSFLMETFFFVFLGLTFLIDQQQILTDLGVGLACVAILLCFRFVATRISTRKSDLSKDKNLIVLICAQGIVPATLSIIAINEGLPLANTFLNLTVYVIILTNIITTVGVLWVTRRTLKQQDDKHDYPHS